MSANSEKSWQRPWSTDEIISNASNWSLAGDAGLLKHLESFSENLLSKADATNNNLNKLLSGLNNASLALDEAKNDFRSLRNTQFIESRVYEDDETVQESDQINQENHENKKQNEDEKLKDVKEAILAGIAVVEKYFDKVEVPGSDSEDETDFPSFVLKPKDPYVDRPLPFLIGTDEWHKKWHVGLLDSSSDSEVDMVSEKFSESDSDDDLPMDRYKVKDIANSNRANMNQPVANSTFDESIKQPDLFGASDVEDNDSTLDYVVSPANTHFANQLAAKLGNFINQAENTEPEVNRKPINSTTSHVRPFGNLFSDEPPPIDDFVENNNEKGLFSGGGLFDDIDNNVNLWNEEKKTKPEIPKSKVSNLFDGNDDLFDNTISYEDNSSVPNSTRGLFDDEDDDLFNDNISKNITSNLSYLPSNNKVTLPYFAEEPPELETKAVDNTQTKKPFGGVKLIGSSDILGNQKLGDLLKQRRQKSFDSSDAENETHVTSDVKDNTKSTDDDNFNVSNVAIPETKSSQPEKKTKQLSLFDDDDEDDERAIFEKDLFSDISTESIIDKATEKNQTESQTPIKENKTGEKPKSSLLFDDFENDEDLFAVSASIKKDALNAHKDDSVKVNVTTENDTTKNIPPLPNINLFDSNPPEIDDYWDSTQESNVFEDNDTGLFDNIPEMSSRRSGLFDNEPPSLFFESSGIVRDISTRAAGTDESFSPYASSSRRFSTDIFNEQQSNDSFFVTKNKSQFDHQHVQSNLDIIPESDSSQSNVDITPSGNADELFTESTISFGDASKSKLEHLNKGNGNANVINNESDNKAESDKNVVVQKSEVDQSKVENAASAKIDSPGKLKHNLKINVGALMPGASPPKKKTVEIPSPQDDSITHLSIKQTENLVTTVTAATPPTLSNSGSALGEAEVLRSVTKDRVRIPVKRRPSTRKARQQSLRNSVPDFKIISDDTTSNDNVAEIERASLDEPKSEFVDIFTDVDTPKMESLNVTLFDDFLETSDNLKKTDDNVNLAKKVISFIEEPPKNTMLEVVRRPVINSDSFESEDYKQLNLFGENEEFDDDMFSSKKLPPKSNLLKESLFDDELDDDDIFGTPTFKKRSQTSRNQTTAIEKKVTKTVQVKKLENAEAVEDPLSSFLNN